MKNDKLLLLLIFLFLLIPTISAQEISDTTICACSLHEEKIPIYNNNNEVYFYHVTQEGTASKWSTFSQQEIILAPFENSFITNYLNPPCSAEGSYNQTIILRADGSTKKLTRNIIVKKCSNLKVRAHGISKTVFPCAPTSFNLEIFNTGTYSETYSMSSDSNYVEFPLESITLMPGENYSFEVFVTLPCELYGKQEIPLTFSAKQSGFTTSFSLELNVLPAYDYSIESSPATICELDDNTVEFSIQNKADFNNIYDLELKGPRWLELADEALLVPGGLKVPVLINAYPPLGSEGVYKIELKAKSRRGGIEKKETNFIEVSKCHIPSVELETPVDAICAEPKKYNVYVKNLGESAETFYLELIGPEFVALSQNDLRLDPGEEQTVNLEIRPPSKNADYDITVQSTVLSAPEIKSNASLKLKVFSQQSCYKPNLITKKKYNVNYSANKIPILLQNYGLKTTNYVISAKPDWVSVSPDSIELIPGEIAELNITTAPGPNVSAGKHEAEIIITSEESGTSYVNEVNFNIGGKFGISDKVKNALLTIIGAVVFLLVLFLALMLSKSKPEIIREEKIKLVKEEKKPKEILKEKEIKKKEEAAVKKPKKGSKLLLAWLIIAVFAIFIVLGTLISHFKIVPSKINETITEREALNISSKAISDVQASPLFQYKWHVVLVLIILLVLFFIVSLLVKLRKKRLRIARVVEKVPLETLKERRRPKWKIIFGIIIIIIILALIALVLWQIKAQLYQVNVTQQAANETFLRENASVSAETAGLESQFLFQYRWHILIIILIIIVLIILIILVAKLKKKRVTKEERETKQQQAKITKEEKKRAEKKTKEKKRKKSNVKVVLLIAVYVAFILVLGSIIWQTSSQELRGLRHKAVLMIKGFGMEKPGANESNELEQSEIIEEGTEEEPFDPYESIRGTFLYHEWKKNNNYEIDLSEYFFDPDGDVLTYSTTQPENITATIDGSLLILTPDYNWTGTAQIKITARDDAGGEVTSPTIILNVVG